MPRIVSFLPSATEIACTIGAGGDLVGRSHECDFPPEVKALPIVSKPALPIGEMTQGEIDSAVASHLASGASLYEVDEVLLRDLQPDVVFTQDLCQVCAPSGTELARLPWNGEEYSGASFGGDGRWLVIASRRNLAVWDTRTVNTNGAALVTAVCGEKLTGAQRLTAADVAAAPVLAGREGEDVCARPSALQPLAIWR